MKPAIPAILSGLLLAACAAQPVIHADEEYAVNDPRFADVTAEQWSALSSRRFYFGHQSVGGNVLQGIAELRAADPRITLAVRDAAELGTSTGGGLFHSQIGVNGDPASKRAEFAREVDASGAPVAMMKFCYLDMDGSIEPNALFDAYAREVEALRTRHPGLRVVHFTMPVVEDGSWKERLVKRVKGRPDTRTLNGMRARYNALLLERYGKSEPVFDIARLESTRPDGSRTFTTVRGEPVYHMAAEWTDDGGHLNAAGRKMAAERLLALLATL